jgi:hypothetical protein
MKYLKRSVALGFRDWRHMKNDPDLNLLRDLPQFQKILAELEADEPELLPIPKTK